MEKEATFRVDAGDAAPTAASKRGAPRRAPRPLSWLALLALAALTAGSLFVAFELPVEPPHSPSTPLLRKFCDHADCAFLGAEVVARDVRLAAPAMRAGAATGTLVFSAAASAADARAERPWPALVFEFFDADRRSLQVRRVAGDDYAPPGGVPEDTSFALEITFAGMPSEATHYSITQAAEGARP